MKKKAGVGISYDLGFREIIVLKKKVQLYYLTGLCDSTIILEIINTLVGVNDSETNQKKIENIVENRLVHQQVSRLEKLDEIVDQLLSGLIVIFLDGIKHAFV